MTEYELFCALRPLYPPASFALLPQVANGTGARANRHADGLAMGLWPSRGIDLHGFEIKCYRGDWKRELENPAKAEAIAQYCNFWWIVAPTEKMIPEDELPRGWGLYAHDGEKLVKKVNAQYREAKILDPSMIAAIFRKAQDVLSPDSKSAEQYTKGYESGKTEGELSAGRALIDYRELRERVTKFQKASGVDIDQKWRDAGKIGEAVRLILDGTVERSKDTLLAIAKRLIEELEPSK